MGKEKKVTWLLIAVAILPYVLYGFQYFPILDDYIQYWGYGARNNPSYVFFQVGTLSTRPIASFLDVYFWGRLWNVPGLALMLITAMLIGTGRLLGKTVARYGVHLSPFFYLIFWLLPIGMEGRFWLSASTRVVTGLFFASLSLFVLSGYLQEKRDVKKLILFALLQLISCGFYESVSIFSAGGAILLFCITICKKPKQKPWAVPIISVCSLGVMFIYYKIFAGLGALGSRASGLSFAGLGGKFHSFCAQILELVKGLYQSTVPGMVDGLKVLSQKGFWGYLLLVCIVLFSYFLVRFAGEGRKLKKGEVIFMEICGALLFLAPLLPNLLAAEVWLTNRSIFVSVIGAALMAEPLFALTRGGVRKVLLFLCAFVFITASVNEYDVYRRVHEQDMVLVDKVIARMEAPAKMGECEVAVLLPAPVETEQNAYYKDHVKSVFGADWSLTGAVRARMESLAPKRIYPVLPGEAYNTENTQVIDLEIKPSP